MNAAADVPVIVLAAGGSRRLGEPKQLIRIGGVTLLRRAATTALEAAVGPVLVVLGSEAERLRAEVAGLDVTTLVYAEWRNGIGGSIAAAAVEQQRRWPDAPALILTTCDQPSVSADHLRALVRLFASDESRPTAVASSYAGTRGIPCLFARQLTPGLRALRGDRGAKWLLEETAAASVPLADGELDIDHAADLLRPN